MGVATVTLTVPLVALIVEPSGMLVTLDNGTNVLVPGSRMRTVPLTGATLRHLVTLDAAGAVVLPASPAFYSKPKSMQQLVDFVAGKILDVLGVDHDLFTRWDGRLGPTPA